MVHGDCVGADADVHKIAMRFGITIEKRPCTLDEQRAYTDGGEIIEKPKLPLLRNKDIVNFTDVLLTAPYGMKEQMRSGTWATIRYAIKTNKPVIVVWPELKKAELKRAKW